MEWMISFLLSFYGPTPYIVILLILLACGLGVPIPEDITLFAGGLLAYYGICDLWYMIALCMAGVIVGDSIIFFLGFKYGKKLTRRWLFHKLLPDDRLLKVQTMFHERGDKLLFAARFMPGLRAPVFFSAGTLQIPYYKFLIYNGGAALLSVPAIVGAVYYFGDELDRVIQIIKRIEYGIIFVIFGVILFFIAKWYWKKRKKSVA